MLRIIARTGRIDAVPPHGVIRRPIRRRTISLHFLVGALLLPITLAGSVVWAQDAPAQAPVSTLGDLPHDIVKDVRRLASKAPLATLAVAGGLALAAHPIDDRTVATLSGSRRTEEALDAGSVAGNGIVQLGGAAAV
jgi:hypothetical protein